MKDGRGRNAFVLENRERVVPRLSGVDHQRQVVGVRKADLLCKNCALHVTRRVIVEVVEAALANPHDAQLGCHGQQRLDERCAVNGIVGVRACGSPYVEPLKKTSGRVAYGRRRGFDIASDGDHARHAGRNRSVQGVVERSDARVIKMTVRIGPGHPKPP